MAKAGKKGKKVEKPAKANDKVAKTKAPKQAKAYVPADVYTLFLGLSALFLVTAAVVLGLNWYVYQTMEPPVLPMNTWAR